MDYQIIIISEMHYDAIAQMRRSRVASEYRFLWYDPKKFIAGGHRNFWQITKGSQHYNGREPL